MSPAFVRHALVPPAPPPVATVGVLGWVRRHLFGSLSNILMTFIGLYLLWLILPGLIRFLLLDAVWDGASREDCLAETVGHPVGACWPFIAAKFRQLVYGFYPQDLQWRVNLVFALGAILLVPLLVPSAPYKLVNAVLFFAVFPVVAFFLLVGGVLGLDHVDTRI